MNISNVAQAYRAYESQKIKLPTVSGRTTRAEEKRDIVVISSQAKDFQTVKKALQNSIDPRQERVQELKAKFESGKYQIQAKDVAEKLFSHLSEQ